MHSSICHKTNNFRQGTILRFLLKKVKIADSASSHCRILLKQVKIADFASKSTTKDKAIKSPIFDTPI